MPRVRCHTHDTVTRDSMRATTGDWSCLHATLLQVRVQGYQGAPVCVHSKDELGHQDRAQGSVSRMLHMTGLRAHLFQKACRCSSLGCRAPGQDAPAAGASGAQSSGTPHCMAEACMSEACMSGRTPR